MPTSPADSASYAVFLSDVAMSYARHIGTLAGFATCPELCPLPDEEEFERPARRGVHNGFRNLRKLRESPLFGACLAGVGYEPDAFHLRLESSSSDALQLTTILVYGDGWGRHAKDWALESDRQVASRVASAATWFRDLAIALDAPDATGHADHAPTVGPPREEDNKKPGPGYLGLILNEHTLSASRHGYVATIDFGGRGLAWQVLRRLERNGAAWSSKEHLRGAWDASGRETPDDSNIYRYISLLRSLLKPVRLVIKNASSQGWKLAEMTEDGS
jgi:hypothetical protein